MGSVLLLWWAGGLGLGWALSSCWGGQGVWVWVWDGLCPPDGVGRGLGWAPRNPHWQHQYLALNVLCSLQCFSLGFFNFHFTIMCFCQHYQKHVSSSSKCNFLVMYYCLIIYIAYQKYGEFNIICWGSCQRQPYLTCISDRKNRNENYENHLAVSM